MEWRHEDSTLILINKFGRERSTWPGVATGHCRGSDCRNPLVIGASTQNLCDFLTFVGYSATRLRPDVEAITAWYRNAIERGAHSRFRPRPASVQA
jgi:hypothetical protein